MRHIRIGNNDPENFDINIEVPYYVNAIWCKECATISVLKNVCSKCGSTNVYHIWQKQYSEKYKELSTCNFNKKGRIKV